ncbi:MAG: polymerase, sigma 28 subunit, FliA/WhiG subfamily [Herbinix sp.]|nr:polymerase, sigma 28 subunit, FliA/WhiG subfamily [Herbinix sp.]
MRELDYLAVEAKSDPKKTDQIIKQSEHFILKCASTVTHRYITKSDDEWSIALLAFHQAINTYQLEKGNFYGFAELVIRRRLIDYIRSQEKHHAEIAVDPIVFDTEPEENEEDIAIRMAVADRVSQKQDSSLKLEIEAANEIFSHYGFSFFDLADCSPQAKKTKKACANAVNYLLDNPVLINEIKQTQQLPLKIIEKKADVPRKILERHRKYIIAAVEILSGEYPYLAEYLRYIREEKGS